MSSPTDKSSNLESALEYAQRGWPIFPIHGIRANGCTCAEGKKCRSAGKHPKTRNGLKNATKEEAIIRGWFQHGDTNIGILTGEVSGLIVVDVDAKNGGLESLKSMILPKTLTVETGGGGYHFYFQYPAGQKINNSASKLAQGVDIRANGGYVVAPPSTHISGKTYRWSTASE